MPEITPQIINSFDGGMRDDYRSESSNGAAVIKHFEIHNFPHKLNPIRGMVNVSSSHLIGNIILGSDGLFYGIGTDDASPTTQALYKMADPASPSWTVLSTGYSSNAVIYNPFVEYKNYFYTLRSGFVMRFDRASIVGADVAFDSISWSNTAQGVVHPKDDILYIPYDNKIWSLNGHGGSPNDAALTMPSYLKITAIAPYGNYLAIACAPVNNTAIGSIVYLWDRDTSLATLSESIDWGTGVLKILNTLDGYLIGISDIGGASTTILDRDSIEIKVYNGGTPQLLGQISTRKQTSSTPDAVINEKVNFIRGRKMYFSLSISGGGTSPSMNGLWAIGKNNAGQFAYNIERIATTDNSETGVLAASIIGNYCAMVHTAVGTVTISTSSATESAIFTATSTYETTIKNLGDSSIKKKLIGVSVMTEPLPSSGSVTLKYRKDEDINDEASGWTTIFTNTTDDSISHSAINIESSGANLPEFKEIQFQILSTGGAVITGLKYKCESLDKDIY